MRFDVPAAKSILPQLATKTTSSVIDNLERKIRVSRAGETTVIAGKRMNLFILKEDIDNIIRITKSIENSGSLIDEVTEAVQHETEKQEVGIFSALLASMAVSLITSMASSLTGDMFELWEKKKGDRTAGTEYNNMDHTGKKF